MRMILKGESYHLTISFLNTLPVPAAKKATSLHKVAGCISFAAGNLLHRRHSTVQLINGTWFKPDVFSVHLMLLVMLSSKQKQKTFGKLTVSCNMLFTQKWLHYDPSLYCMIPMPD